MITSIDKYLLEPKHHDLYEDAVERMSEVEFFRTELAFLRKLLNKSFLRAVSKSKISELAALENKIKYIQHNDLCHILNGLIIHERHLALLDEDAFSINSYAICEEHGTIIKEAKAFATEVKKLKKEIFDCVEDQMKQSRKIMRDYEDGSLVL